VSTATTRGQFGRRWTPKTGNVLWSLRRLAVQPVADHLPARRQQYVAIISSNRMGNTAVAVDARRTTRALSAHRTTLYCSSCRLIAEPA